MDKHPPDLPPFTSHEALHQREDMSKRIMVMNSKHVIHPADINITQKKCASEWKQYIQTKLMKDRTIERMLNDRFHMHLFHKYQAHRVFSHVSPAGLQKVLRLQQTNTKRLGATFGEIDRKREVYQKWYGWTCNDLITIVWWLLGASFWNDGSTDNWFSPRELKRNGAWTQKTTSYCPLQRRSACHSPKL